MNRWPFNIVCVWLNILIIHKTLVPWMLHHQYSLYFNALLHSITNGFHRFSYFRNTCALSSSSDFSNWEIGFLIKSISSFAIFIICSSLPKQVESFFPVCFLETHFLIVFFVSFFILLVRQHWHINWCIIAICCITCWR